MSDQDKPTSTFEEFLSEDARANLRRLEHQLRLEHKRDGCPLERGAAGCPVCGVP